MATPYEQKVEKDRLEKVKQEKMMKILESTKLLEKTSDIIELSTSLIKFLVSCGCEEQILLVDMGVNSLKLHSRVPMNYLVFPQERYNLDSNPMLHQFAMRTLMKQSFISNVKWIPHPEGSHILVLTKFD